MSCLVHIIAIGSYIQMYYIDVQIYNEAYEVDV